MRTVMASAYALQEESRARQSVASARHALRRRGIWRRLRDAIFGPGQVTRAQQRRVANQEKNVLNWVKGRSGESLFAATLSRLLDDRYLLICGLTLPGSYSDIDGILLGPHGVTVYEVKALTGIFAATDDAWSFWSRRTQSWEPARANPSMQVLTNIAAVQSYLRQCGFAQVPVSPVIVLASSRMHVRVAAPMRIPLLALDAPTLDLGMICGIGQPGTSIATTQLTAIEHALLRERRSA